MYVYLTTTIKHLVEISDDGLQGVTHSVEIDGDEGASALPQDAVMAIVEGGCKSVLTSLQAQKGD